MEAIKQIISRMQELREMTGVPVPQPMRDKMDPELSNLPLKKKHYHIGPNGNIVRNTPKRTPGLSARQDKKIRKLRKRWLMSNKPWFGAEEAAKVGDRRI